MAQTRTRRLALPTFPSSLVVLIAAVVTLLVAGSIVAVVATRQPAVTYPPGSPEATAATYLRLLQNGQVDEAYALTAFPPGPSPYGSPTDYPMTRERFHAQFDQWSETPHQVVLLRSTVTGDHASVTVEITAFRPDLLGGNDQRAQQTLTLVRQDGVWRVTGPAFLVP